MIGPKQIPRRFTKLIFDNEKLDQFLSRSRFQPVDELKTEQKQCRSFDIETQREPTYDPDCYDPKPCLQGGRVIQVSWYR